MNEDEKLKSDLEWTLFKHLGSPFPYPAREGLIKDLVAVVERHTEAHASDPFPDGCTCMELEHGQRSPDPDCPAHGILPTPAPGIAVVTAMGTDHYDAPRWEESDDGRLHIFDRKAVRVATYAREYWLAVCTEGANTNMPNIRFDEGQYDVSVWWGARLLAVYGCMTDGLHRYNSIAEWNAANE